MGGGSSGGGGGSGAVDYPDYMETQHGAWLTAIANAITAASNPYTGYSAYDPDDDLTAMIAYLVELEAYVDSFDSDIAIENDATAYDTLLQNIIDSETVPAFEAGMRDINAVQSSAFVVGKALIYARKDDQVADYTAKLKSDVKLKMIGEKRLALLGLVDVYRMKIVAKKEEYEQQMETEALYEKWNLDKYMPGGDMLSAIGGGHSGGGKSTVSKVGSGIGGAMSGASVGNQIYPGGWGAGIGGILGGIGGFLS